jgi:hypothetical protein
MWSQEYFGIAGCDDERQAGLFCVFALEELIPEIHLQRSTYQIQNIDALCTLFIPTTILAVPRSIRS